MFEILSDQMAVGFMGFGYVYTVGCAVARVERLEKK